MEDTKPSTNGHASIAPAAGKAGRLARSRAACTNCHKAKQRCEGPSVCPCHRCVTFGIECVFPSSVGPSASKSTLGSRASPTASTSTSAARGVSEGPSTGPDLAEQLRIMTARLESIESSMFTLARATLSGPRPLTGGGGGSHSTSDLSPHPATQQPPEFRVSSSNPVEIAGEGLLELAGPGRSEDASGWATVSRPDVIDRGIMTLDEVEAEFNIYFQHIHPWMALLSIADDRQPSAIRDRAPLLFHAIILLTTYYRPRTSANLLLYRAISSIVDSILAPLILCPQPDQLNADLIRALYLMLLYKPIQLSAMSARGVTNLAAVEHMSKLNVRASWLLRTLCIRVSAYISLPSITTTFARAFANQDVESIPENVINDQRLYFSCIWHSMHGGLQSGSRVEYIPQEAIKTTRLFATLRRQPTDVRLAANVELSAIAAALLHTRQENDKVETEDLIRFCNEMDAWEEYWDAILAAQADDPISYTSRFPYAAFIRVVICGMPFSRWKAEKREYARTMDAASAPPTLSAEDHSALERAVVAAAGMMLALTTEGRTELSVTSRGVTWAGVGATLTLDANVVSQLRWASDSLTCVVYSYSLLFLAKLANQGYLRSDLTLIPFESSPLPPAPLDPADRICRLLQLGAELLDAVAANPHHPAVKQAAFLRRIRDAGISGRRGGISAPGSPHLAPHPLLNSDQLQPQPVLGFYSGSSFDPTPVQSPQGGDVFSALLNGVSPSVFDSASFFGLEMGPIDWELDDIDSFTSQF